MPICRRCGEYFKGRLRIDGVIRNLYKRFYCTKCSPFKKHNTKKLYSDDEDCELGQKKCARCKKTKNVSDFYLRENGITTHSYCRDCNRESASIRILETKKRAVEYKGGKCLICGYNKCLRALDFHHTDKKNKSFSMGHVVGRKFENIKSELDKCVLVCKNCHAEIEDGVAKITW